VVLSWALAGIASTLRSRLRREHQARITALRRRLRRAERERSRRRRRAKRAAEAQAVREAGQGIRRTLDERLKISREVLNRGSTPETLKRLEALHTELKGGSEKPG
jgi:vacuolar-type H+-ATPase subunit E/Vma4